MYLLNVTPRRGKRASTHVQAEHQTFRLYYIVYPSFLSSYTLLIRLKTTHELKIKAITSASLVS